MKLKKILIAPAMLIALSLTSCGLSAQANRMATVYENTSSSFTGYTSQFKIIGEEDIIVYEETNTFAIQRGEVINTSFSSNVRRLNDNISVAYPNIYNEESSSYITIGNLMYLTATTGVTSETAYDIPTSFLSFSIEAGYINKASSDGDKITGSIKDGSLSNFFNGNTITDVSDFNFEAEISDDRFSSFSFTYIDSGDSISLNVECDITFSYETVNIQYPANN